MASKRDSNSLKKCWENLKSKAKKSVAKEKRQRKLTGGGRADIDADPLTDAVVAIIPGQMHPLQNPYDDDTDMHDLPVDNEVQGKTYM